MQCVILVNMRSIFADIYTQDLEIVERHLIVDTKEDTTADYEQQFSKDMEVNVLK